MNYRVRSTPRAEADLERLYSSIRDHRDEAAARDWYESFCIASERLRSMPFSCGLAFENPHFDVEVRHLIFGPHPKRKYRALFTVEDDQVVILTVRAPGEKPATPDSAED